LWRYKIEMKCLQVRHSLGVISKKQKKNTFQDVISKKQKNSFHHVISKKQKKTSFKMCDF
jgi:hypothetical protein